MPGPHTPQHKLVCESCGQIFNKISDVMINSSPICSHSELYGIADARGMSTLNGISGAMQEIERLDCICRHIIVSSTLWMKIGQHDVESNGKILLWGAEVHFSGAIYIWNEMETNK